MVSPEIEDDEITIDNYHITRLDRNRHMHAYGGGVLMYTKSRFSVKVMSAGANDLELFIVSVMHMSSHCLCFYYVALFYRPPSSHIVFVRFYIASNHTFNILIGDFNVYTQSFLYRHLTNSLASFSLHQIVNSVTHTEPSGN